MTTLWGQRRVAGSLAPILVAGTYGTGAPAHRSRHTGALSGTKRRSCSFVCPSPTGLSAEGDGVERGKQIWGSAAWLPWALENVFDAGWIGAGRRCFERSHRHSCGLTGAGWDASGDGVQGSTLCVRVLFTSDLDYPHDYSLSANSRCCLHSINTMVPFVVSDLGLPRSVTPSLLAAFHPGYILTQIPSSFLVKSHGPKFVCSFQLLGSAGMMMLVPVASNLRGTHHPPCLPVPKC